MTEDFLPEAIHGHSRCQRIGRIDHPLREAEPVFGCIVRERMQSLRGSGRNFFAHLIVLTTHQNVGHGRSILSFGLNQSDRAASFDGRFHAFQFADSGGKFREFRVVMIQIKVQRRGLLLLGPLIGTDVQ